MKHIMPTVLTAAMILISLPSYSARPDDKTFQTYASAATCDALFSRHKNIVWHDTYYQQDEIEYSCSVYIDDKCLIWKYSDGIETLLRPDIFINRYSDTEPPYYVVRCYDNPDAPKQYYEELYQEDYIIVPKSYSLLETTDKDGSFYSLAEVSGAENVQKELEEGGILSGVEYQEGMRLRYAYTFDKNTKDLTAEEVYWLDSADKKHPVFETEAEYDAEIYDPAKTGEPFAEYFALLEKKDEFRSVTLVFDPNTAEEKEVSYALPCNIQFRVYLDQGIAEKLYTDRECTQAFADDNGRDDLKLYIPKAE
ncbi:MAG: hypothetical protein J6S92_09180 [Oscillospiraceae bacterium]|nr:hypothetical protein [Oscillospiraceae bacterium]